MKLTVELKKQTNKQNGTVINTAVLCILILKIPLKIKFYLYLENIIYVVYNKICSLCIKWEFRIMHQSDGHLVIRQLLDLEVGFV